MRIKGHGFYIIINDHLDNYKLEIIVNKHTIIFQFMIFLFSYYLMFIFLFEGVHDYFQVIMEWYVFFLTTIFQNFIPVMFLQND
jgi:hypothetical protein